MRGTVTLSLVGDVMLGRGVDQILPHPGDPTLREAPGHDAGLYVWLAESVNGPIPKPVDVAWPWGVALETLDREAPDVRIVNLETSVTSSDEFAPGKGVHYRMNPANLACLAAARPDVCVLANNHVLDFGRAGLEETLDVLAAAGLRTVGAGRDAEEAGRPAVVPVGDGHRVLVLAVGMASSGVPSSWAAAADRPGVAYLGGPSRAAAGEMAGHVRRLKRRGDVVVASVHWGPNWGYDVSRQEVAFAHALVDGGVDVVHGHSSHHPRPLEVYRGHLVLYGCGDFIDDYEGITGYEEYRDDLRLLVLATVDATTGELVASRMHVMQARKMRLHHASEADTRWLGAVLDKVSRELGGCRVEVGDVATLVLGGGG